MEEDKSFNEKPEKISVSPRQVCDEEGNDYLSTVRNHAPKIALGVACCVFSPTGMFLLAGLSESGVLPITTGVAGGLGVALILLTCALGVWILIRSGLALSKYDYLEKEEISISEGFCTALQEKRNKETPRFAKRMALGVAMCILAAVPLILAGALNAKDCVAEYCLSSLFPVVACGVYIFVRYGMIHGSYAKLLQEDEYTVEKKRDEKASAFSGAYWCFVTALYLGWSFTTMQWHRTWIVWPVAGVLFAAFSQLIVAFTKKKK